MKLLTRTLLLFFFVSVATCHLFAQSFTHIKAADSEGEQKLKMNGHLKGLKDGEMILIKVFFYPYVGDNSWKIVDTIYCKDEQFNFEHKIEDGPRLFSFSFSDHNCYFVMALDNEKVTIHSDRDIDSYVPPKTASNVSEYLNFEGSKTADEFLYLDIAVFRTWYWSLGGINNAIQKFKDSTHTKNNLATINGLLFAKNEVSEAVRSSIMFPYIRKLTPELFTECQGEMQRDSIWVSIYNKFDEKMKRSYNSKIMATWLPLCMGQPAPDFNFTNIDGKSISLTQVSKSNKITILHFWSGGSADRARINKELSNAYKKYHAKGFEIVNVSFDGNEYKWKKLIKEDTLPGYHYCDFKEEDSPLSDLYKVDIKSTVNLIIDQNGRMLAYDIDGPALFGYLYRIFGE